MDASLTSDALYSFGLMQRIKNGWQAERIAMRESRDFLNCVPKVGARFLVSVPSWNSLRKRFRRNLLLVSCKSFIRSWLKVSRFFSKKSAESKSVHLERWREWLPLTLTIVCDISSEVSNAEADDVLGFSRDEVLVSRMIGVEFVAQRSICAFGKSTLFVDQRNDIHRFDGNQIENPLIIFEGDVLPIDVFVVVFLLFEFEDVMDEELLEILIGVVDAKLFETIPLEVLESEDVQDAETKPRERELLEVVILPFKELLRHLLTLASTARVSKRWVRPVITFFDMQLLLLA